MREILTSCRVVSFSEDLDGGFVESSERGRESKGPTLNLESGVKELATNEIIRIPVVVQKKRVYLCKVSKVTKGNTKSNLSP